MANYNANNSEEKLWFHVSITGITAISHRFLRELNSSRNINWAVMEGENEQSAVTASTADKEEKL